MYYVKLREGVTNNRFDPDEPILVLDHGEFADGNFQLIVVDKHGSIGAADADRFVYLGRNKTAAGKA